MWWGWRSTARVYLGKAIVMTEAPGRATISRQFERGLPWEQALERLTADLPSHAALDVHLSGAVAPAILLEFPEGLRRYRDRLAYAKAACARLLGRSAEALRCELDPFNPRICVAVDAELDRALASWSARHQFVVRNCEALWAHLSSRREMRAVPRAMLREPDSVTALCVCDDGSTAAVSLPLEADAAEAAAVRRALAVLDAVARGTGTGAGVRVAFGPRQAPETRFVPEAWAAHWSRS